MSVLPLSNRCIFHIVGSDAEAFLQRMVVSDIRHLTPNTLQFSALLSPQGKVLFDFFLYRQSSGALFMDCDSKQREVILHAFSMYTLRSDVQFRDVSQDYVCCAAFGDQENAQCDSRSCVISGGDPRHPALGERYLMPSQSSWEGSPQAYESEFRAYHLLHLRYGVPQGGIDFVYGTIFPTDVLMDLFHSLSYDKGCYIGQEVVSRLYHREKIRSRFVGVSFDADVIIPRGADIILEGRRIGTMGSSREGIGLALIRLDRLQQVNFPHTMPNLYVGHSRLNLRQEGFWDAMWTQMTNGCENEILSKE
jgi:folate-binding protein YgfZ